MEEEEEEGGGAGGGGGGRREDEGEEDAQANVSRQLVVNNKSVRNKAIYVQNIIGLFNIIQPFISKTSLVH